MSDIHQAQSLMKAIHHRLANDLMVQAVLGETPRLYDHIPEDPIYPYLTYGDMRSTDVGGDDRPMTSHTISLHIWSRYSGREEILRCLASVSQSLENGNIVLNDAHFVSANIIYTDNFRAPDGRTLHGIIRLNVTTHESELT